MTTSFPENRGMKPNPHGWFNSLCTLARSRGQATIPVMRALLLSLLTTTASFGQFEYGQLRSFTHTGGDGASPDGTLVEGNNHALFGVTSGGGSNDLGTVFQINTDGG